jgi:hypothetical protein
MEGIVAKCYAGNQKKMIGQYKSWANKVSRDLAEGSSVLEVAPGPGYLPEIELKSNRKFAWSTVSTYGLEPTRGSILR